MVPKHDVIVIMGDFNAKIGKEDSIRQVAGRFSLHDETSDNGFLLAQFAELQRMTIKSTCFPHKQIHKGTQKIPGSKEANQIDHAIISTRYPSSIIDARAMRGPNCDSDHYLVRVMLRQRLAKVHTHGGVKRIKWNVEKLKVEEERNKYNDALDKKNQRETNNT